VFVAFMVDAFFVYYPRRWDSLHRAQYSTCRGIGNCRATVAVAA
jgi:hypothetical protein